MSASAAKAAVQAAAELQAHNQAIGCCTPEQQSAQQSADQAASKAQNEAGIIQNQAQAAQQALNAQNVRPHNQSPYQITQAGSRFKLGSTPAPYHDECFCGLLNLAHLGLVQWKE